MFVVSRTCWGVSLTVLLGTLFGLVSGAAAAPPPRPPPPPAPRGAAGATGNAHKGGAGEADAAAFGCCWPLRIPTASRIGATTKIRVAIFFMEPLLLSSRTKTNSGQLILARIWHARRPA